MANKIIFPLLILYGLSSGSVLAEIYKYVDENGQVHYSNEKPTSKQYKHLQYKPPKASVNKHSSKKIKIIPEKDIDNAVRNGKITKQIALRIRYFYSVEKEYHQAKKKKRAMRRELAKAKSNRSSVSSDRINQLQKEYDEYVKEDYYYTRRNYTVARQKLKKLLESHYSKSENSTSTKKKSASINWN